jgi:hypothetical protein
MIDADIDYLVWAVAITLSDSANKRNPSKPYPNH